MNPDELVDNILAHITLTEQTKVLTETSPKGRIQLMYDTLIELSKHKSYVKPKVYLYHRGLSCNFTTKKFLTPRFHFRFIVNDHITTCKIWDIENSEVLTALLQIIQNLGYKLKSIGKKKIQFTFKSSESVYDTLINIFGTIIAPGLEPMSLADSQLWSQFQNKSDFDLHNYVMTTYESILVFNGYGQVSLYPCDLVMDTKADVVKWGFYSSEHFTKPIIKVKRIKLGINKKMMVDMLYTNHELNLFN